MLSKENEELVRSYVEWQRYADPTESIDRVWAEKIAYHGRELGELTTRDQLKAMIGRFSKAMPDLVCTVESMFGNDEYVVAVLDTSGTELGDDGSGTVKRSGKKVHFRSIDMWRIKDGRLVEQWIVEGLVDYHNPERARVP